MSEETIFAAALEKPADARAAYLAEACGHDETLRKRLEGLLAASEKVGNFMANPAVASAADPVATQALSGTHDAVPAGRGSTATDSDDEALTFLAPPARPDSLGRIGHYEVLQVLGQGGFGIVFRAFDDVLHRVVAVKVLSPQLAATSPARKRFLREARSSAQVRHENVVQVYEVGEQPLPYIAMEFIPGETLQQRLDRVGPVEPAEVVRVGRQIAEGLAAAHATDLIHRDIKPGNVLLEGGQQKVKITDFGLARAADDASISQSGIIAGTPMYMAPEQACGQTLDQRADLFSLGSVLYQMVAGRPPFRANSAVAVLKRVAEDQPRAIREIIPETPQWLCDIISKLHAKNPDDRYQSAREVADVLADCEAKLKANAKLKDYSRIPRSQPQRSRRRKWVAAASVLLVLVLLLAVLVSRFGGAATLYFSDRGELQLLPQAGLVSVIVLQNDEGVLDGNKLHTRVTDWLDMKKSHTLNLPPGRYQLSVGTFPAGTHVREWEVTTSGLLASNEVFVPVVDSSAIVTVERGCRITLRAKMRTEPAHDPQAKAPPPAADTQGWRQLFNGKDLTGWKTHPDQPGQWKVEGGVLVGSAVPSYLYSEGGEYRNFHLRVEAKINNGGDSGIFFRAPFAMRWGNRAEQEHRPAGGYEVELHANPTYLVRTGSIWDAETKGPPKALWINNQVATRPDEWFTLEIIVQGSHFASKVNGTTTADCHDPGAHYDEGHFALQVWNPLTTVHFRKIEIKELPATAAPLKYGGPEYTNTLGMKFKLIPAGKFTMGSPKEEIDRCLKQLAGAWLWENLATEGPEHLVEITKPFYLGVTEVTVGQFRQFVDEQGYQVGDGRWRNPGFDQTDQHPVVFVSWNNAVDFCKWLSAKEGKEYRLPTEAEWEYSCRAGKAGSRYGFGDDDAQLENYAWFDQNSGGGTHPVGKKKPNAWGLYDMHGNAWEWCQDNYDPDYYKNSPVKDPPGGAGGARAGRGGGWVHGPVLCRSAFRGYLGPDDHVGAGFRVLLVPPPAGVGTESGAKDKPASPAIAPFTDADVQRIAALPAAQQVEEVRKELKRRNPGFDGKMETKIEGGVVTEFQIASDKVTDIAPIRVFDALRMLVMASTRPNGLLADLTPLEGMNLAALTHLGLWNTKVSDAGLAYFKDCKGLRHLGLGWTKVSDAGLANFKDCKNLIQFWVHNTQVGDAGLAHFHDCKDLADLNLAGTKVSDVGLAHFKDCKNLKYLWLDRAQVGDAGLAQLKGIPLRALSVNNTAITDLAPLQGMPLEEIRLTPKNITRGLDTLRDMKSLKTIGIAYQQTWPTAEFWERYGKGEFGKAAVAAFTDADVQRIAALRRNPGFDGKMETKIAGGVVTEFKIVTDKVTDIAPIRVFNALRVLECGGTWTNGPNGLLVDLKPLEGMNLAALTHLNLIQTKVTDGGIVYFKGCKDLRYLNLNNTKVTDRGLAHFKDCQDLTILDLNNTKVTDIGLAHVKDCKALTHLLVAGTKVSDTGLAQFKGMSLILLWISNTDITDLTPLQGMPLEEIRVTPKNITRGLDILRDMKSLKTIGIDFNHAWPAAEFWERYDKREFKK